MGETISGEGGATGDGLAEPQTEGVRTLLGDPKKAVVKLSFPTIVAMTFAALYNVTDTIWVSGLGPEALSVIGFIIPFIILIMGINMGLGIGGGTAISRNIGSMNKRGADNVVMHTLAIMLIIAALFTVSMILFLRPIFLFMGAGKIIDMVHSYSRILFGGSVFMFFSFAANAILRSEGDAKRAMRAMIAVYVLNMIMDPLFIYILGMGISGAALSTLLSSFMISLVLFHWLFIKRDTYVSINFRGFRFNKIIVIEIFRVGFPAFMSQISTALLILTMNMIIVRSWGTDGVAVYSTGMRVVWLTLLPVFGISTAVVAVAGASYGARDSRKLGTSYIFSIKMGLIIEGCLALLTFLIAPLIAKVFTWSEESARIAGALTTFFKIIMLMYPSAALAMLSSSMFMGVGKGFRALTITIARTFVFTIPFALFLAFFLGIGLSGIWAGIVLSSWTTGLLAFLWARKFIGSMQQSWANSLHR
jgi:putative MATE family efflux protein